MLSCQGLLSGVVYYGCSGDTSTLLCSGALVSHTAAFSQFLVKVLKRFVCIVLYIMHCLKQNHM